MPAFRVCAADPCHTIQIITAREKMFTNVHDTVKMKLAILISVLPFVNIAEISEMFFEYNVQDIPATGYIAGGIG